MNRRSGAAVPPAPSYARRLAAASVVVLAAVLAACGLPDEQRTEIVDDSSVPYDLLDPGTPTPDDADAGSATPRQTPVVFWLSRHDLLTPSDVGLTCDETPTAVVDAALSALVAAPSSSERDAGLSSAIPSNARLTLLDITGGVAEVDLDPVTIADAERLPLAVGQVVLSVTSAPGVDAVRLVTSGQPVDLPLPSGALATRDVTPEDYAALLPERLADGDVVRTIGCSSPSEMTDR